MSFLNIIQRYACAHMTSKKDTCQSIGDYKFSASSVDMKSWFICDGRTLNISDYPELYAIIGVSFGGDGLTTFQLPNCIGKVPAQVGLNHTLGQEVGEETHVLSVSEIPTHSHYGVTTDVVISNSVNANPMAACGSDVSVPSISNVTHSHQFSTNNVGENIAHNIMQPTIFIGNMFILVDSS